MMEWRFIALLYIIFCCICSHVKSRESRTVIEQLADGLKYDGREESEDKSVISRSSHRMPSERNILEKTVFLNILCGQLKVLQKQQHDADVIMCSCRNSTLQLRNSFRPCKIWRPVHLNRYFLDDCARQRTGNYSVWFAGKLVNNSGIKFKYMMIYSTTHKACVQVAKATTHMCNIIRHLISNIIADFPEDFRDRMLHQPLSHHSRRFKHLCSEHWPRGNMDIHKGCLYRHCRRCRVNVAVSALRTRRSTSNTYSRIRCCREIVIVLIVFGWQNSHEKSSTRNGKQVVQEYMVNRRLLLHCLSSQDRKQPSIYWEMGCPLCVECALILTMCPHSSLALISWRQSLAEMKRVISKWKIYDNESMALSVIARVYRTYGNKHDVRKDTTRNLNAMDVKEGSTHGYATENDSNMSTIPYESTSMSAANINKNLRFGGQVVSDVWSFKHSGQHNLSDDTLGHSRDTDYKLSSVETVHPRPTSTGILNSSIIIKGVHTRDSETVFHSFHEYFKQIKMPSINSFQEQVPRDTHNINPNGVLVNPQLHGQVAHDTHIVQTNGTLVNPQLPGQVARRPSMNTHLRRRRDIGVIVHDVTPVNMAILLPMSQNRLFCKERVFAAIEIAMKRVEDQALLPSVQLQARYADSHCSISDAMNAAIEFYAKRTVSVFLGPVCDYAVAPIARQIRYWQLPLVTPGAMAGDFGFRKTPMFPLLTRVGSNFNSLLELLAMLLKQFAWQRMKLIYMPDGFENIMDRYCHIAADAIVLGTRMGATNITVDHKSFHEIRQLLQHMSAEIGTDWGGK